jgi:uncharacterized protein
MPRLTVAVTTVLYLLISCAPARAQDIDPAIRADIEKLLAVTGVASNGARLATTVGNQLIDTMRRQQPQMPPRIGEIIKEVLGAEFTRAFTDPMVHGALVRIYAAHFSRTEISALLDFYSTELGRKLIVVTPQLAEEAAAAGQQWATANMPRILGIVQQRLRDEKLIP